MEDKIKILYVDDKPNTDPVAAIVDHLRDKFIVAIESNAVKARKRLLKEPFDILALDWEMVKQDNGAEILTKIRQENALIKVIVVTDKLRRVSDLQLLVNLGISKLYFKYDDNLLSELDEGIIEVADTRDTVLQSLEDWLKARENLDEVVIEIAGDRSYTASQILDEIKRNTNIGRKQAQALVKLTIDIISSKKTRKK